MSEKKLHELIHDISFAMFTTAEADGTLRSRPLTTVGDLGDDLYFFSREESATVGEIDREHHVNLAYAEPKRNVYVSVSGVAEVVRDRALIEKFWKPLHKAFFPEGVNDPALTLIRVRPTQAEYWDAPSSKVVNLIGMAKALATGKAYRPGANEKLSMGRVN